MGLTVLYDEPLYDGSGVTNQVPFPFDVAIGGRPYVVSFEFTPFRREAFRHISLELLRPQADTGSVPDESTVNPQGLWRRSQDTWHHGAGQNYLDRKTSDLSRFRYSKGMDVWTTWQMSVLNDTVLGYATVGSNLRLAATAARVYLNDGTKLGWTAAPFTSPPFTPTVVTLPAACSSMVSDGYDVYCAVGASGVYTVNDGVSSASQIVSSSIGAGAVLGYALGRLMLGDANKLYNITSATVAALPSALATSYLSATFAWVGFAEGNGNIYAAGNLGSQGQVFKIAVTGDGTALGAPSAAMPGLPRGETISAIYGYLGVILLGTSKGVRVAIADSSGNLTVGSLITTPAAVTCFEGQDRFVWFGYTNPDAASTGLGRLDLSTVGAIVNAPDTPAWASDIVYSGQGAVTGVASWTTSGWTGRVFAVAGVGIVVENKAAPVTGVMQTGLITYDLSDLKYGVTVDALPGPNAGTFAVAMSNDGGAYQSCGSPVNIPSGTSKITFPTPQTPSNTIELQYTLTSTGSAGAGSAAVVHRTTLKSMVAAIAPTQFKIPLRLSSREMVGDMEVLGDPAGELDFLNELRDTRQVTTYQSAGSNGVHSVVVDLLDWTPDRITGSQRDQMAGVCSVIMTEVT